MKAQTSLSGVMKSLITNYNVGAVATVNQDGSPAVSPKATFVIVDNCRIAYGDIRSPGTSNNIKQRPGIEVVFTDVLARQAIRVRGIARIIEKDCEKGKKLLPLFERSWKPYIQHMSVFVTIDITRAELIMSPAYDLGIGRDELVKTNFEKLNNLAGNPND